LIRNLRLQEPDLSPSSADHADLKTEIQIGPGLVSGEDRKFHPAGQGEAGAVGQRESQMPGQRAQAGCLDRIVISE
jgi:hypothetical protein